MDSSVSSYYSFCVPKSPLIVADSGSKTFTTGNMVMRYAWSFLTRFRILAGAINQVVPFEVPS